MQSAYCVVETVENCSKGREKFVVQTETEGKKGNEGNTGT